MSKDELDSLYEQIRHTLAQPSLGFSFFYKRLNSALSGMTQEQLVGWFVNQVATVLTNESIWSRFKERSEIERQQDILMVYVEAKCALEETLREKGLATREPGFGQPEYYKGRLASHLLSPDFTSAFHATLGAKVAALYSTGALAGGLSASFSGYTLR